MAEDQTDDAEGGAPGDGERPRTGLRRRLGRLLNQRELAEDTREVLGGMLEMSDRAKTEAVKLVAREARNYLDELKIKEDILELITSHSLELQLSVHLKPLADAVQDADTKADAKADHRPEARADRAADAQTPKRRRARAASAPPAAPEPPVEDPETEEAPEASEAAAPPERPRAASEPQDPEAPSKRADAATAPGSPLGAETGEDEDEA